MPFLVMRAYDFLARKHTNTVNINSFIIFFTEIQKPYNYIDNDSPDIVYPLLSLFFKSFIIISQLIDVMQLQDRICTIQITSAANKVSIYFHIICFPLIFQVLLYSFSFFLFSRIVTTNNNQMLEKYFTLKTCAL